MLETTDLARLLRPPTAVGDLAHLGIIALGILGAAIMVLSILPWIEFPGSVRPALRGPDVDAITGVGDGYLSLSCGVLILAASIILWFRREWTAVATSTIATAGLVVFTVGAIAATRRWQTNRDYSDIISPVDGDPTAALVALAATGVAVAILAVLLATRRLGSSIRQ
jgi:hypothetical protein